MHNMFFKTRAFLPKAAFLNLNVIHHTYLNVIHHNSSQKLYRRGWDQFSAEEGQL